MNHLPILQKISAQLLSNPVPAYRRSLYATIDFNSKMIGIKGPRGAGKSTLLRQYAKSCGIEPSKILFISCDHPMMAGVGLYDVAEAFYARGGVLLIIDEIHKSDHFSQQLKAIYDVFNLQVLFSGSSALRLEHAQGDLSRRAVVHYLGVFAYNGASGHQSRRTSGHLERDIFCVWILT